MDKLAPGRTTDPQRVPTNAHSTTVGPPAAPSSSFADTLRAWGTLKKAATNIIRRNGAHSFGKLINKDVWDESIPKIVRSHLEIARVMKSPRLQVLTHDYPWVVYRYFGTYLAKSIPRSGRREILRGHYVFLISRINDQFFDAVVRGKPKLWQSQVGANTYAITLEFSATNHYEGDLLLAFEEDSVPLYFISFTIAPGHAVGSTAAHAMLVARVQGAGGKYESIRHASKLFGGVPLPHLLISAVQGISAALDISVIAGIKITEQLTAALDARTTVLFDYDAFWKSFPGVEAELFYLIPVKMPDRVDANQIRSQRSRMKKLTKYEIAISARRAFVENFLNVRASECLPSRVP